MAKNKKLWTFKIKENPYKVEIYELTVVEEYNWFYIATDKYNAHDYTCYKSSINKEEFYTSREKALNGAKEEIKIRVSEAQEQIKIIKDYISKVANLISQLK